MVVSGSAEAGLAATDPLLRLHNPGIESVVLDDASLNLGEARMSGVQYVVHFTGYNCAGDSEHGGFP